MKAIVLFSGGLDSLLTVKLLQEQGFTVIGLNIVTPFFDGTDYARARAEEVGIELRVHTFGQEYMDMLRHPRWGVGKAVNPCIDCRILMCRAAAKLMEETGAEFVATGEIAGQRPNSQKIHQLNLIDRESGLQGKLLRPLSAKLLPTTTPETEGLISRDALHSYNGRFRRGLISLGKHKYELPVIPQPSTGCLLCEKSFAPRIRDLLRYNERPTVWDAHLVDTGRHIRLDEKVKCVLGRREADNEKMVELFDAPDKSPSAILMPDNFNGPAVILTGSIFTEAPKTPDDLNDEQRKYLDLAGALILMYTNPVKYEGLTDGPIALARIAYSEPFDFLLHRNDDVLDLKAIQE